MFCLFFIVLAQVVVKVSEVNYFMLQCYTCLRFLQIALMGSCHISIYHVLIHDEDGP